MKRFLLCVLSSAFVSCSHLLTPPSAREPAQAGAWSYQCQFTGAPTGYYDAAGKFDWVYVSERNIDPTYFSVVGTCSGASNFSSLCRSAQDSNGQNISCGKETLGKFVRAI